VIDVTHQINEVARRVEDRVLEAGEARAVIVSQTYDATVDELWDAVTDPERIPRWFLPVTGDLRLGGRYQLEGNAGGTITECEPPHRFAATWEFGEAVTWIEVRVSDAGDGRARFELEHVAPVEEHWTEFGPGAVGIGWDLAVVGLHLHLAGGGAVVDPAEVQAWQVSPDGLRFVTESGEAWLAADLAAGADPDDARRRSDNTIAAYTTPPPTDAG
jgi:uncharacterized protein YndB with AHSA1/START domain